jgi:SAM-dependent methyltransferase
MARWRTVAVLAGAGALAAAVAQGRVHGDRHAHQVDGGVMMDDADRYAALSGRLLGGFYQSVAADVAAAAPVGSRVLELGCGPGHLAMRLVRDHGLDVVGLDLDPAMVARARLGAERLVGVPRPEFVVGDAAALPFTDSEFDLVVSTLSLHHWTDPAGASAEVARVLRPGGRVLVWDILPGRLPMHRHAPDPARSLGHALLEPVSTRPWRWPWRVAVTQRLELVKPQRAG